MIVGIVFIIDPLIEEIPEIFPRDILTKLPELFSEVGQPVLIGGSMGTASYILAGSAGSEALSYASACHGAGRCMKTRSE